MSSDGPYSSQQVWELTINRLFNGPESEVESTLSQLYSKDCLVTANGKSMNWEALFAYINDMRRSVKSIEIKSRHWIRKGNLLAENHDVTAMYSDGKFLRATTMILAEVNENGQAAWLDEVFQLS